MPKFSKRSLERLETCDPRLIELFKKVVEVYDCSILEGHRSEELQNLYFDTGRSKLRFPESKHNQSPSKAVDVAPYPIDWEDRDRFYHFGGFVQGLAQELGFKIRWGGDWDSDRSFKDQTFHDLPHFEILD